MATVTSNLSIKIAFSAQWWSFISSTRIFVASFCGHSTGDAEFSDRVATVLHELLENAVKYSFDPSELVHCTLEVVDGRLHVRVENRADPEHRRILLEEFENSRRGDPLENYIARIQASVDSEKSQLGLARIRYEGEAELALAIDGEKAVLEASFAMPQTTGARHE